MEQGLGGEGTPAEEAGFLDHAKRVCDEAGCDTRLSRYNDGEYCALHAPMTTPRMRGVKDL